MFDHRVRRAALKTSTAAIALLAFAAPAVVQAQTAKYSFDIPSQDVSSALIAYGRAARQQLVFDGTAVRSKQSSALVGEYSAQEGLYKLLEGTGLHAEFAGSGAIRIVSASDPQSGSAAGDGAEGTVQALIVTAQKREENIQDVPIAMSAFTQEDLTRSQVAGGPDLMTQVPNFTFTKTNFSGYSIQIRGIGTQAISVTTDPAVAVAFNNTPFIRNRFFEQEFYDLQRVEVLRGPQGTLYGRNATAGVVNIISAKPKFAYEARFGVDVANYASHRLEGMLNLPLVDDKVALRLAGAWTKRDGYTFNASNGARTDGRDLWSTRLSLRVAPTDSIEANLVWEHFQEDDDRLRSGKQLCRRDNTTELEGIPIYFWDAYYYQPFNQGCLPASLYSPDAYQAPYGPSLPYKYGSGGLFDVYASTTQSRDLRVIETELTPQYKANSDIVELQFRLDLSDNLTLSSETGYNGDEISSFEDYNRFTPTRGAFQLLGGSTGRRPSMFRQGQYGLEFCDPQLGCSDHILAGDLSAAKSRQVSQEFRLASNYEGPFNFSLGANFLRYDTMEKYYVFINTLSMRSAANWPGPNVPLWPLGNGDNYECLKHGLEPPDFGKIYDPTDCNYIDPNPIGALNDMGHNYFLSKNPYKLLSYAVFGEAYYNITNELKLTAGLRWTVDRKAAPRIPSWVLAGQSAGYPVVGVERQEWREPTGRLTLDWKPHLDFTDDTLFYGSYAHGYKAGGSNPPPTGLVMYCAYCGSNALANGQLANWATHPLTFRPEFVNAFEVGTKNTLLDGQLTLNANAFYYDYTDYQISQIIDRSAVNYNFDAKIHGFELEADWRPLENLHLGLKGGYEKTRMGDGQKAVDVMDRTAGHAGWVVVKPFPSFPSNCIVPIGVVTWKTGPGDPIIEMPGDEMYNGNPGPCEYAYAAGLDPLTKQPYTPLQPGAVWTNIDYTGFDPATAPNHGAGFDKDLSGHELPNAPHYTATLTADYTLPLPHDWLTTLHADLYYQSEAWTRVFNTPGYDKLKAYSNVNFAAIFTNEDAGWKIMAYVKNVMDKDNITGAFLNSDDTGLTTNVFLSEPRLYGLRITKEWTGEKWWTGANSTGPYPLTVELGGAVQHNDAAYEVLAPSTIGHFSAAITPLAAQNRPFDWGDGRSIAVRYRPGAGSWSVSASFDHSRVNTGTTRLHRDEVGDKGCAVGDPFLFACEPGYGTGNFIKYAKNFSDTSVSTRESHTVVDFSIGKDVGLGLGLAHSSLDAGVRYADFSSRTNVWMSGVTDWQVPDYWIAAKYSQHDRFGAQFDAERAFSGAGPALSWKAARSLLGSDEVGHVNLDWSLTAGVLFGKQRTAITGSQSAEYFNAKYGGYPSAPDAATTPIRIHRDKSATTPVLDLGLGLSYEIQRVKVSTGYRWERYYNALDAGFTEHKSYDRAIDGPYFRVSVGFGG